MTHKIQGMMSIFKIGLMYFSMRSLSNKTLFRRSKLGIGSLCCHGYAGVALRYLTTRVTLKTGREELTPCHF